MAGKYHFFGSKVNDSIMAKVEKNIEIQVNGIKLFDEITLEKISNITNKSYTYTIHTESQGEKVKENSSPGGRDGGSVAERLPSMCEALGSILSTTYK